MHHKNNAFPTFKTILAAAVLAGSCASSFAQDTVDLHFILPLTGGASFVGHATQKGMQAAEDVINADGGINGKPVRFVYHDDQTSPQVAVQWVNQLSKEPLIMGSEIAAMCNAMAPLLENGPFTYCLSPAINPKPGSYMFSTLVPLRYIAPIVLRYLHSQGWNRVALLVGTDATGQEATQSFEQAFKLPENADMKLVKLVHFNPTALNVSAQMTEISEAKPQAVIGWAVGAPAGTILKGFVQAGIDLPLVISHGNVAPSFMKKYADVLPKRLYMPAGLGSLNGENITIDPRLAKPRAAYLKAMKNRGAVPESAIDAGWDPVMLAVDALRHVGPNPTPAKIRDYLNKVKGYAGISGVYDFQAIPNRGLIPGTTNAMARWNAQKGEFEAVSEPGGYPIPKK